MSEAIARILEALRPGETVFLPGSTGEVPALSAALAAEGAPALDITASFVPGINPPLAGRLPKGGCFGNPFAGGARGGQAAGAMRHLPLSYAGFAAHLSRTSFDTVIVHVAPPDSAGRASLGSAVEFTPIALRRAGRLIAVINQRVPAMRHAEAIDIADAAVVVEIDAPLREYDVGAPSAQSGAIARNVAAYIGDGAALQIGLGKGPDALLSLLGERRNLRLHSGMLSGGARLLAESGALDAGFRHTSCIHVGTQDYYDWLAGRDDFAVRACDHTHAPQVLAAVEGLVAVNAALSVDLFGQANLEMLGGRAVSGVGGAADFARAASLAPSGLSIVALPAASGEARAPRIVPRLDGVVSLPRHDIDIVVTEHGAADLRGACVMERAERLIAIAEPRHHGDLEVAWREIAGKM
ncbi:acetyl-CoA hydrolase/transferase C-terminal domain-containing protein [soil metagenome]